MTWLKQLKHHPFPVVAHFQRVVAVSFAFPEAVLRPLVPTGLTMDTYEGMGFLTVAMVWTNRLRPAGFPEVLGQDFFLAGYRMFTRLCDVNGRKFRGLRILRSETDKRRMVWAGNLVTDYRYRRIRLFQEKVEAGFRVRTTLPDGTCTLDISLEIQDGPVPLPENSPFKDWRTARLFAGPMPFTFSPSPDGSFVVIEGSRQHWEPRPIRVRDWRVGLFNEPPLAGTKPLLANAFMVEDVPYRWERGRIVQAGGDA